MEASQEKTIQESTESQNEWEEFVKNMQNKPPRGLVKRFVEYLSPSKEVASKMHLVDIGCGAGSDTLFYNAVGFNITAVDSNAYAVQQLDAITQSYKNITVKFCDITLEAIPMCDIASASYCLPFLPPSSFDKTWNEHIVSRISPGGYFVGHFLGVEDGWAVPKKEKMTFLTEEKVRKLFNHESSCFEEFFLKEKKKNAALANGGSKYWHIFTVFARKKTVKNENEISQTQTSEQTNHISLNCTN